MKTQDHHVVGYVIMPNHIHVMISFFKTEKSINKIIGDGKRFIAYDIIKRLEQKELKHYLKNWKKLYPGPIRSGAKNMKCGKNRLIGNFVKLKSLQIKS